MTHYQRLLNYIVPDVVHVLADGRIVRSGGKELALELEEKGYGWLEARGRGLRWRRHWSRTSPNGQRAGAAPADAEPQAVTRVREARLAAASCARLSDDARRGVAVHQRRADCRGRVLAVGDAPPDAATHRCRAVPAAGRDRSGAGVRQRRYVPALSTPRRAAERRAGREPGPRRLPTRGQRARATSRRASRRSSGMPFVGPEHGVSRRRRLYPAARGRDRAAADSPAVRRRRRAAADPTMAHPRVLVVSAPTARRRSSRHTPASAGARVLHQHRDGGRARRERRRSITTSCSTRAPRRITSARSTCEAQRSASCTSHSISLGGALVRNDVVAVLDGEGVECTLNGLYSPTAQRLVDNHTTIDHAQPHCGSREMYKGILADHARGVFNGKIIVRPDAQKTDAKQTNARCCCPRTRMINTKPQLEIFANDVKCTHGAAVGQLDDEALFYLRSRGLGDAEARRLLIHAFAADVLNRLPLEPVRAGVETSAAAAGAGVAGRGMRRVPMAPVASAPHAMLDVARDPQTTFRSCGGASTASRSSTWTTRRRRRSRRASSIGWRGTTARRTRTFIAACTCSASRRPTRTTRPGSRCAGSSTPRSTGDRLRARRDRGDQSGRADLRTRAVGAGDEVVISEMEHHSNIVPWQMLCEEKGARLRVDSDHRCGRAAARRVRAAARSSARASSRSRTSRTRSARSTRSTRSFGWPTTAAIPVLIDGAQAVAHMPVDVQALGCDFYAFSGHKVFGPTGIGVLYGRASLLEAMPPYQGGGDMIRSVTFERTLYNDVPYKFEAGTPNIAGVVGLAAAIEY